MVPYQEAPAPPMTPALHEACRHAVHVVTADGETLAAGRAVLFVLGELGYRHFANFFNRQPLLTGIELGYRLVADNRQLIAKWIHCPK